jgi:hypothetical protein
VVEFAADGATSRVIAAVASLVGQRLVADIRRVGGGDKREYPRVDGALHLCYRLGATLESAEGWLAGGTPPGEEHTPDPFMNLSVTGIQFEDVATCREGDLLLVEFKVPGEGRAWRCAASVVRVLPIPPDERDTTIPATHRIAVNLLRIPPEGAEALLRYTIRLQDTWLESLEDPA